MALPKNFLSDTPVPCMCVIFDAKFGDVSALVKHMSDVGTSHDFNHKKWDIYDEMLY